MQAPLTMTVESVHAIASKGKVLVGRLEGTGVLRVGDLAGAGPGRWWEIQAIEGSGEVRRVAAPGQAVGVVVEAGAAVQDLAGATIGFEPRPAGRPALTEAGWPVPDQAVLVGWVGRRLSPTVHFAALVLEAGTVRLVTPEGAALIDAPGSELRAGREGATHVVLADRGDGRWRLVGPDPGWLARPNAKRLAERFELRALPDPRLTGDEGRLWKLGVTPAAARVRVAHLWQPVIVAMLRTRGVGPL